MNGFLQLAEPALTGGAGAAGGVTSGVESVDQQPPGRLAFKSDSGCQEQSFLW